jgi:cytochrome c oxidase subunit 4
MSATAAHGRQSHTRLYLQVFAALAILTVAEVLVVYMPMEKVLIVAILVGLALGKAIMVAAYYMHLRFEKATLALIAAIPLFLCVFLAIAMGPDHSAVERRTATVPAADAGH